MLFNIFRKNAINMGQLIISQWYSQLKNVTIVHERKLNLY